jgi:hypothetical protein
MGQTPVIAKERKDEINYLPELKLGFGIVKLFH